MKIVRVRSTILFLLAGAALVVAGGTSRAAQAPFSYMYMLMVNVVGPAGNALEHSIAETLGDADWARLKQEASKLTESADKVAFGGTSRAEEQGAKSGVWQSWSAKFGEAASAAELAIDRKDKTALVAASSGLVETCEGCHKAFPSAVH